MTEAARISLDVECRKDGVTVTVTARGKRQEVRGKRKDLQRNTNINVRMQKKKMGEPCPASNRIPRDQKDPILGYVGRYSW